MFFLHPAHSAPEPGRHTAAAVGCKYPSRRDMRGLRRPPLADGRRPLAAPHRRSPGARHTGGRLAGRALWSVRRARCDGARGSTGPPRKPDGPRRQMGESMSDDGSTRPPAERGPRRRFTLTRRGFLAGTGVTVAAVTLDGCKPGEGPARPGGPAEVLGPDRVPITLKVNGAEKRVAVEPRTTLAEALRLDLDLTGTKIGCDRGACSACTVWVDGTPVCACMTFALDVGARPVTTIEGLARGDRLHPVQEAFIEHDAMQCGFCTPGMIDELRGAAWSQPVADARRRALRHQRQPVPLRHLSKRVRGHPGGGALRRERQEGGLAMADDKRRVPVGIVSPSQSHRGELAQVERTAPPDEPPPWPVNEKLSVVGKPTPRLDGRLKVTGRARYTADINLPGMLHARVVRSPHPHARVRSIDTSAAERAPGVRAVHVLEHLLGSAALDDPSKDGNTRYPGGALRRPADRRGGRGHAGPGRGRGAPGARRVRGAAARGRPGRRAQGGRAAGLPRSGRAGRHRRRRRRRQGRAAEGQRARPRARRPDRRQGAGRAGQGLRRGQGGRRGDLPHADPDPLGARDARRGGRLEGRGPHRLRVRPRGPRRCATSWPRCSSCPSRACAS